MFPYSHDVTVSNGLRPFFCGHRSTMAATVATLPAIDLKAPSSYPIRLGSSITKPADSKTYSAVRYNHKPRRSAQREDSGSIEVAQDGVVRLCLGKDKDEYSYEGKAAYQEDRFVLLCRGSGKDKELVLERLDGSYGVNLTGTPSDEDASKLAERYHYLPPEDEADIGLPGNDDDEGNAPDQSNPFDYRNHLQARRAEAVATGAVTPRSTADTPKLAAREAGSTPLPPPKKPVASSSSVEKKRKTQGPLKPSPKRVKAGAEPPAPLPSAKSQRKDVPAVRIDRKASIRQPPIDDSGELILENETPVTEKPPRAAGSMALALSGQLGQGPISLRSAASSPASRNASPAPPRPEGIESPAEFALGESSPETSAKKPRVESPGDYFSNAGDDDEDADADVEDLELPSPRQRRKSVANAGSGGVGADEDYDMERELELALAQDDGAMAQPTVLNESDEESEEE